MQQELSMDMNQKETDINEVFKNEKKSIYTLIILTVIIFIFIIIISIFVAHSGDEEINPIYDNSEFVIINEEIPEILTELRYYTSFNFIGEKIDGYEEPVAIIKKKAIENLRNISKYFYNEGYVLKIWDSYRPSKAGTQFLKWKENDDNKMKEYFYPNKTKNQLFDENYINIKSHSKGCSIDLTLVYKSTGLEVDFGTGFDFFDEKSNTNCKDITEDQKKMRESLKKIMEENGFENNPNKWWHYTLKEIENNEIYDFTINATKIKHKIFE